MHCNEVRKYIFAFADGQLGVKENCEVLDHLKMCPVCSSLVSEHQSLRGELGRSLANVPVPPALRDRIRNSLRAGRRTPVPAPARTLLRIRPLAVAASIVILASVAVWTSLRGDAMTKSAANRVNTVQRGPMAASLVAKVHASCCDHANDHHNIDLPRKLDDLPAALSRHYESRIVALAPSLSNYGYNFESANYCGVREKPGYNGGHILYVSADSRRLSFFSVPRWDCLDHCAQRSIPNDENYREYDVEQPDGSKLSIVAWHNDATTYICCGQISIPQMEKMVREIHSAMADFDHHIRLASAAPRRE